MAAETIKTKISEDSLIHKKATRTIRSKTNADIKIKPLAFISFFKCLKNPPVNHHVHNQIKYGSHGCNPGEVKKIVRTMAITTV